jgi:hypothetical protein
MLTDVTMGGSRDLLRLLKYIPTGTDKFREVLWSDIQTVTTIRSPLQFIVSGVDSNDPCSMSSRPCPAKEPRCVPRDRTWYHDDRTGEMLEGRTCVLLHYLLHSRLCSASIN